MNVKEESEKASLKLSIQKTKIMASNPITSMANRWGNHRNSERLYFLGFQNHCRWWLQSWNLKMSAPWKENYDQPRQHIKKHRHYFANTSPSSQSYGFSSSHVWMWELGLKESWALKNWCFWTVMLTETLEISRRPNQSIIREFSSEYILERLNPEAESPILWPHDTKSSLTRK